MRTYLHTRAWRCRAELGGGQLPGLRSRGSVDLVLDLGAVLDDTVTALLSADPDAGEERHQVTDTDVVERADGILDLG
jgi:hypothetical protein